MPKVKTKSIGQKRKTPTRNQTPIPPSGSEEIQSQSTENIVADPTTIEIETEVLDNSNVQEIELIEPSNIRVYENMSKHMCLRVQVVDLFQSSVEAMHPVLSYLQAIATTSAITTTEHDISAEITSEPFEVKRASISKTQRKTAKAFMQRNIEEQYEWPVDNESKDDALIRNFLRTVICFLAA